MTSAQITRKNVLSWRHTKHIINQVAVLSVQSSALDQTKRSVDTHGKQTKRIYATHSVSHGTAVTKQGAKHRWYRSTETHSNNYGFLATAAAITLGGTLLVETLKKEPAECQKHESIQGSTQTDAVEIKQDHKVKAADKKDVEPKFGQYKAHLPTYRQEEISTHNSLDNRIWVTFNHGVYDVTEFVESHPGGNKIKLAAGKGLEAFFNIYAIHRSKHVMDIMESLRIGNKHPDDMKQETNLDEDDPFATDPVRHPALRVNSMKPFNAEPPAELLIHSYNTPNELFFVRNHLPVPKMDATSSEVEMSGEGITKPINLSVKELKKNFKTYEITATIQCAGNRRTNMASVKSVRGLTWGQTAISNATWTGVKLADVLKAAGVDEEDVEHVIFQGADKDVEDIAYEASIPASLAFDPRKDVLLAFEMNGEELPLDHGYPIRVVVPGVVGARNVKWLKKIILSKTESESHWQKNDYKVFHPSIDWSTADYSKSEPIHEYPIQSAICEPSEGTVLEDNEQVTLKGYAWSGGGRGIIRVDVSIDGGKTWFSADLDKQKQPFNRVWAWAMWEATVEIPEAMKGKQIELVCKAVDTAHNAQPDSIEGIWNLRGLIHNAWHKVKVTVPQED